VLLPTPLGKPYTLLERNEASVFGIMVAFVVVVWKKLFYKKHFWLRLV